MGRLAKTIWSNDIQIAKNNAKLLRMTQRTILKEKIAISNFLFQNFLKNYVTEIENTPLFLISVTFIF